jgi:hypothetical protein
VIERVYYGLECSGQDRKLGRVPHVLISAATLWNAGGKFQAMFTPPEHETLFLDSGGFHFAQRRAGYPFGVGWYVGLAGRIGADLVAAMDLPCEPGVRRESGTLTNADRIARTVENTRDCLRHAGPRWVPVVQGYTPAEYESCVDLLESAGCVRSVMGIGSLCVRKKADEAWEVIRRVRRRLPDVRLHGFGIDLRFIRDRRIRSALWSCDTSAWKFNMKGSPGRAEGRRFPRPDEKTANLTAYMGRIDRILAGRERPLDAWT